MKIALVILHANPSRGGAERYTIDLATALGKRGHDVSLIATSFSDQELSGVTRVLLRASGPTRTRRYLRMLDAVDECLDARNFDIVHAMLPVRRCDIYHPHAGMAVAAVKQKPIAALFNPRRRAMAQVERELLSPDQSPVVLALSEYVKRDIRQYFPALPEGQLKTLFNAVDLDRYQPLPHEDKPVTCDALFVGKDFHRKGLPQTVRAMQEVPAIRLTVLGTDGAMFRIQPEGVRRRVVFAGNVEDPRPYYRQADFLVLPTSHDPCSLVVLEALSMGVPVVSTRFNGACEIMTDGVHGFVLPSPNDINALAEAMRKVLDPGLCRRMSAACLELRPQLSYEHHLDRLIEIYQQRIDSRSKNKHV